MSKEHLDLLAIFARLLASPGLGDVATGPSRNARYVLEGGSAVEPLGFRPLPTSGPIAIPLGRGVA